jgi:ERCC4-type nuclease
MEFVLDTRERQVAESMDLTGVSIKPLDVGDFQVRYEGVVRYIFERKTLADLSQSIVDGRYREQKMRMKAAEGAAMIYVLEVPLRDHDAFLLAGDPVSGAVLNSMLRDRIPVLVTSCAAATAKLFETIRARMLKSPETYMTATASTCDDEAITVLAAVAGTKKKSRMTKSAMLLCQLCTIPNVSHKTAKQIVETTKITSIAQLCDGLRSKQIDLSRIDRIGKKMADAIADALL